MSRHSMTVKLQFYTILLATLESVLGLACDEVDSLPIQPNCTVKRYWTMYCEVNGQQFTFNNVSVPPGLLSSSTDQPQPTRCMDTTVTVKDTTTATEITRIRVTKTDTAIVTSTSVATQTSTVSSTITRTATVTTTATVTSTAVTTCTSIASVPSPTSPVPYKDCKDALDKGVTQSGAYTIQPDSLPPFDIYCDMDTDGGGWSVFQRRQDGSVDFYRNWTNYIAGFGDLSGEFWLGLNHISRITNASRNELRVDLSDFDNASRYAKYNLFRVGDASTKYRLTVSGYSGTAGDSLQYHNGHHFSTYDQDNDKHSTLNCPNFRTGAWWYHNCAYSNLNGLYLRGQTSQIQGLTWRTWRGARYSNKFTEMMVRPFQ